IGRAFGAHVEEVPLPTGNPKKDYEVRLEKTLKLLRNFDVVYVHLKGPDEPGHDGNLELKKRKIEEIDKYFVRPFLKNISKEIAVMVTADHATPPSAKAHTGDPVPVAIMCSSLEPDSVKKFTEKECTKGKLGVIEHGWELLPRILEIIRAKT
ncbi:MAG: phosphonopyruvate decarboxylase, partial [Thermoprotei archaeon]